jgi:integration host factor subunit beta
MPITKSALIEALALKTRLSIGSVEAIVNRIFDAMGEAMLRGEGIEIRGFGSFTVRDYGEYEGRNPRTGQRVRVRKKRLPFFKVGRELKERVNTQAHPPLLKAAQRARAS